MEGAWRRRTEDLTHDIRHGSTPCIYPPSPRRTSFTPLSFTRLFSRLFSSPLFFTSDHKKCGAPSARGSAKTKDSTDPFAIKTDKIVSRPNLNHGHDYARTGPDTQPQYHTQNSRMHPSAQTNLTFTRKTSRGWLQRCSGEPVVS